MFKVLIVDDELYICEMLKKLIDWQGLHLMCVGEAGDGMLAMEKIRALKPDIVLTDIRMPGVDGLEMVRQMREEFPALFFVLFSGHKDFDYACSAIKYGVEDYLLKPVNQKKLNRVLERIVAKLERNSAESEEKTRKEEQLEYTLERLRAVCVSQILEENVKIDSVETFNRECQCRYRGNDVQVAAFKLDVVNWRYPQENPLREKRFIMNKIGDEALDFLEKETIYAEKFLCEELLYLMLETEDRDLERYKRLFREVGLFMERYPSYHISMGIGIGPKSPGSYRDTFQSAREAVYKRLVEGTDKVLFLNEEEEKEPDEERFSPEVYKRGLESAMETCSEIEMQKWTENIMEEILDGAESVYGKLVRLRNLLEEVLNSLCESGGEEMGISPEEVKRAGMAVFEYTKEEWLRRFVKNTILENFEKYLDFKKIQEARPVRDAKKYINAHYREDITLELLAEKVYLNPIYFSTMFKKEEGMNFSKYLLMVRMDNAKRLLGNQTYTIAQVAELVGYKDYKHFSKVFKKTVGITPNEFRRLNY